MPNVSLSFTLTYKKTLLLKQTLGLAQLGETVLVLSTGTFSVFALKQKLNNHSFCYFTKSFTNDTLYFVDTSPSRYDEHWKPASLYCSICTFPYNYVLHFEDIQQVIIISTFWILLFGTFVYRGSSCIQVIIRYWSWLKKEQCFTCTIWYCMRTTVI